jgi:hypothetical protein
MRSMVGAAAGEKDANTSSEVVGLVSERDKGSKVWLKTTCGVRRWK